MGPETGGSCNGAQPSANRPVAGSTVRSAVEFRRAAGMLMGGPAMPLLPCPLGQCLRSGQILRAAVLRPFDRDPCRKPVKLGRSMPLRWSRF